jgi:hypothetical protein
MCNVCPVCGPGPSLWPPVRGTAPRFPNRARARLREVYAKCINTINYLEVGEALKAEARTPPKSEEAVRGAHDSKDETRKTLRKTGRPAPSYNLYETHITPRCIRRGRQANKPGSPLRHGVH